MDEPERDIHTITSLEAARLAARSLRAGWPGGVADSARPAAHAWLSRWRPARIGAPLPACSCPRGHCAVCN